MLQRLFVDGAVAPGGSNYKVLESIPGYWERASIGGSLQDVTTGAVCCGVDLSDTRSKVDGYLFHSDKLSEHWLRLDTEAWPQCARVEARVLRSDGVAVAAFVYVAPDNLAGSRALFCVDNA